MKPSIKKQFQKIAENKRAKILCRFFKTGKGEYGEGDIFIGITVPKLRFLAKELTEKINEKETLELLHSPIHEHRLCALMIFINRFEKGDEDTKTKIYKTYLANTKYINNWDLVDLSCHEIVGQHLLKKQKGRENRKDLFALARSKNLWEKRIAMVSTFAFIKNKEKKDVLKIAQILINDKHDLIQKAVGWMIREAGKRIDNDIVRQFILKNKEKIARTTLRYAIEKLDKKEREYFMNITRK